jgi:antitoxin HicB
MKNKPSEIRQDRYEIDVVPNEHGGYYARIPDFSTIFTGGQTPDEAMRNALEAIGLMIEEYQDRGLPVPEPLRSFSGTFNVRLPRSVHRELVRRADRQGVSLNAMVGFLLTQAVGIEHGPEGRNEARPAKSDRRRSKRVQPNQVAVG